jgi:large subunit ribosomal protein L23
MKDHRTVIIDMHVTEKGTGLQEKQNKYFFRVAPWANKMEIKSAVEKLFKVSVVGVNTLNYTGKRKRERSMQYGKKSDWKRAVVTLAGGSKIETV